MNTLKLYVTCMVTFAAIDYMWISVIMKKFYVEQMQNTGRIVDGSFQPVMWAVFFVYLSLAAGVIEFVLPKLGSEAPWYVAFGVGALLGLVIYGTYDFTNHSTLKDWPVQIVVVDVLWGAFLCGAVTLVTRFVRDMWT